MLTSLVWIIYFNAVYRVNKGTCQPEKGFSNLSPILTHYDDIIDSDNRNTGVNAGFMVEQQHGRHGTTYVW